MSLLAQYSLMYILHTTYDNYEYILYLYIVQ